MNQVHIFNSEAELIKELQSKETKKKADDFFAKESSSISDVVMVGVAGSTYRAFRNLPHKPSEVFRMWACAFLEKSLPDLKKVRSEDDYQSQVHIATIALCKHWDKQMCSKLGYGRGAKLLNLVLKKLACLHGFDHLIKLQHIPLDSYTIRGLRKIAPELHIKSDATMNFIETPEQYNLFQNKIRDISRKAGTPAIHYDILAWDLAHRKIN